jgi:hypothetical protein
MFRMRLAAVRAVALAVSLGAMVSPARAQQPQSNEEQSPSLPAEPQPSATSSIPDSAKPGATIQPAAQRTVNAHRFWDRENRVLFAAVGAGRAFDYASTMNIRRRGINEVFLTNAIVDNHPLFAGIEAAATGASIGVSYIFHRTGHHSLERWTSIVHFGIATGGAIRNYALPTPH